MTLAQSRALLPLLTKIGDLTDEFREEDDSHLSPPVYLTLREWSRILEEFGTP